MAEDAARFEEYRSYLFAIAYRMLGNVADAEDMIQDTFLRYQAIPADSIISIKALLTTIVTRLCLNQLQSARYEREQYIGPWLPEPILTVGDAAMPAAQAELQESLSLAFLVLLEQLSPVERAVFLLREVFGYDYPTIAQIVEREEAACRQIQRRARQYIAAGRPRFNPAPEAHRDLLQRFLAAVGAGEIDGLIGILARDAVLWTDGGGKARGAATRPVHGASAVARFMLAATSRAGICYDSSIEQVNGAPAIVISAAGTILLVIACEITGGQMNTIWLIGNPDKLQSLNRRR